MKYWKDKQDKKDKIVVDSLEGLIKKFDSTLRHWEHIDFTHLKQIKEMKATLEDIKSGYEKKGSTE
jgi:hypothetical protein